MKIGINKPVKEILYENQKITERSLSAEHWPSLTGLITTNISEQFVVLSQNITPLSDKYRTLLYKLPQFSKAESLEPQQQSRFCKDHITTLILFQPL